MPTFVFTDPSGKTHEVTGPEGATEAQAFAVLQQRLSAATPQTPPGQIPVDPTLRAPAQNLNPTAQRDVGIGEQLAAGAARSFNRAGIGLAKLIPGTPDDLGEDYLKGSAEFVKNTGPASSIGEFAGDVMALGGPGAAAYKGARAVTELVPKVPKLVKALTAATAAGAGVGAAVTPEDRKMGATAGAIGGFAGEGGGRVLQKALGGVFAGKVTPGARQLMDEGVDVPAWKAVEGPFRDTMERAKVFPLVRNVVKGQERRAIEQWNRSMVGKASPPIPVTDEAGNIVRWKTEPVKDVGHTAMVRLKERFSNAYDALYKGRVLPLDDQFTREVADVAAETQNYFPSIADDIQGLVRRMDDTIRPGTEAETLASRIVDQRGMPFTSERGGHAGVTYEAVKRARMDLDDAIESAWRRGDAERARQIEKLRDAVNNLQSRGLPPEVASLKAPIDEAYTYYKRLQRAASTIGAAKQGGVVSPAQVVSASKALDRTPGKSAFSEGNAPVQREALRAGEILGSELPEIGPGTGEKLMLGLTGVGAYLNPMVGAGLALGTPQGQRAMLGGYKWQEAIRQRPEIMADLLRKMGISTGVSVAND